jgi:hypothetical protein
MMPRRPTKTASRIPKTIMRPMNPLARPRKLGGAGFGIGSAGPLASFS